MSSGLLCLLPTAIVFRGVCLSSVALLAGCAGVTSSTSRTPTPTPPPPAITVTLSATTSSVQIGGTQTFTVTIANDSQNTGVTWALSGMGCAGRGMRLSLRHNRPIRNLHSADDRTDSSDRHRHCDLRRRHDQVGGSDHHNHRAARSDHRLASRRERHPFR